MTTPDNAGLTLLERIRRSGPLTADQCVLLALKLAEGLAAGHARGLVHGNLNPGSVILTAEGAHFVGGGEHVRGASAADDVHALGMVLIYAATGLNSSTPEGMTGLLHEIITMCLAQSPEHRPSAADLVTMLRSVAPPAPSSPIREGGISRRSLLIGGAAVAAVGVGAGIALLETSSGSAKTSASPTGSSSARPHWPPRLASARKAFTPQSTSTVTAADISNISARACAISPASKLLAAGFSTFATGTSGFVQVWSIPDGKWVSAFSVASGFGNFGNPQPAFSPDGNTLAISIGPGVQLWDLHSATLLATASPPSGYTNAYYVSFSPDGKTLAAVMTNNDNELPKVVFWTLSDTQDQVTAMDVVYSDSDEAFPAFAFSPDGSTATIYSMKEGLITLDLRTGKRTTRAVSASVISGLAYSPDSATIATVADDFELWDATGTASAWATWTESNMLIAWESVRFSPDGTYVLGVGTASGHGANSTVSDNLYFWNAKTGKLVTSFSPSETVDSVCVLPDGSGLVYSDSSGLWMQMFE